MTEAAENRESSETKVEEEKETEAERNLRFNRQCRHFIDYINYDWEFDEAWTAFKGANMKDIIQPKQVEEIKREYFKMNVNSRLETSFTLHTEDQKSDFLEICRYVGTILSLGQIFKSQGRAQTWLSHAKHIFYFLYLITFPVRGKLPTIALFFIANCCSLAQRKLQINKKSDSFMSLLLADEEAMHVIWFLTFILTNWQLRFPVDFMFLIWAYLNTCEWFDYIHWKHPSVPIVGLFGEIIQLMQDNTIQIIQIKNYIEVVMVPLSLTMWLMGWCAPVLGIILVQAVRIKYLGSNFTRKAMRDIDSLFKKMMPGFVYAWVCAPIKGFLSGLAGVKESLASEQVELDKLKGNMTDPAKKKDLKKNLSTVTEEEDSDEPQTYEIDDDGKPMKRNQTYEVAPEDLD